MKKRFTLTGLLGLVLIGALALVPAVSRANTPGQGHDLEFYGFVQDMPEEDYIGVWVVGNRNFEATEDTEFKESSGLLQIGAYVRVSYYISRGVNYATEIETVTPPETPEPPQHRARLGINPAAQWVSLSDGGGDFTVEVWIAEVTDLGAFEFNLRYDPSVVWVQSAMLGDFLGSTGRAVSPVGPTIDNANGQLTFGAFSLGEQAGPDGSGVLATITFSSQAAGISDLDLQEVQTTDTTGAAIPNMAHDGRVIVTGDRGVADVDGDGDVDIVDVQLVAGRWRSQAGDASYGDGRYDLDGDGDVDIVDIQMVAGQWGWHG